MKFFSSVAGKGSLHKFVTAAAGIMVAGGVVLAVYFFVYYNNHEETNDAQVEQYVTPVSSRISGYIQEVRFQENDFVKKGDTLVVIDRREFKAHLDKALADELISKNAVTVSRHTAVATGGQAAIEQAKLAGAQALMAEAGQDLQRYKALYKEEAATLQQVEHMQAKFDAAKSHYEELRNSIKKVGLNTAEANARIAENQAVHAFKTAEAQNAALYYSYTVITAPYDGFVGRRTIQPGQLVKEGQTLLNMVSSEKWIIANFKETQLQHIEVGQKVVFTADAVNNVEFTGVVESVSSASGARFSLLPPDNATGNFVKIEQRIPVKIVFSPSQKGAAFLRAGMNVVVVAKHKKD